jgi:hypothetical protein
MLTCIPSARDACEQKRDGRYKARLVAGGAPAAAWAGLCGHVCSRVFIPDNVHDSGGECA